MKRPAQELGLLSRSWGREGVTLLLPPPPEHLPLGPRRTPHAPTIFRDHLPRVCKRGLGWRARRGGAAERDPEGLVCTKGTGVGAGSEKS